MDGITSTQQGARMLRLAVIRNLVGSGKLSRDEALDLLKGPLTPGDDTTIVDDSGLIDATFEEAIEATK